MRLHNYETPTELPEAVQPATSLGGCRLIRMQYLGALHHELRQFSFKLQTLTRQSLEEALGISRNLTRI